MLWAWSTLMIPQQLWLHFISIWKLTTSNYLMMIYRASRRYMVHLTGSHHQQDLCQQCHLIVLSLQQTHGKMTEQPKPPRPPTGAQTLPILGPNLTSVMGTSTLWLFFAGNVCFQGSMVLASQKQQGDGWIPHADYLLLEMGCLPV